MTTSLALLLRLVLSDPKCVADMGTDFDCFAQIAEDREGRGSYEQATRIAQSCQTPTAWVERDACEPNTWIAVCGTADGRTCGSHDADWTSPDCQL